MSKPKLRCFKNDLLSQLQLLHKAMKNEVELTAEEKAAIAEVLEQIIQPGYHESIEELYTEVFG